MRVGRLTATCAAALVTLAGTGCSAATAGTTPASRPPRPPATIPADPAAAFAAAKTKLGTESARFALDAKSDMPNFTGIVNAKTRNWEITGKEYVIRRVGTDLYLQASGKTLEDMPLPAATAAHLAADGWVHTGLPNGHEFSLVLNDGFPWNWADTASHATGITRTGSRSYSGTVTVKNPISTRAGTGMDVRLGVDLDEQGRFVKISAGDPKSQDRVMTFAFSDYGVGADITAPPPGDVVEVDNPGYVFSSPGLLALG